MSAANFLSCPCGTNPLKLGSIDEIGTVNIRQHLSSNLPLSTASEHSLATEKIAEFKEEIKRCVSILKDRKKFDEGLSAYRQSLADKVRELHWLVSPLRTLPSEILYQIFNICVLEGNVVGQTSIDLPSVRLSQVCSRWRNELFLSPRLWNNSSIGLDGDMYISTSKVSLFIKAISAILGRSGDVSLKIAIYINPGDWTEEPFLQRFAKSAIQTIESSFPSCRRWESLTLHVADTIVYEVVDALSPVKGKLERLENLELNLGYHLDGESKFIDLFRDVPCLRSVTLAADNTAETIALPWGSIEKLVLDEPGYFYTLLHTFDRSSSLHHLELNDTAVCWSRLDDLPRHTVLHARSVEIRFNHGDTDDSSSMAYLRFPYMKSLELEGQYYRVGIPEPIFPIDKITTFLSQSSCTLTSLYWVRLKSTPKEFIRLLKHVPSLRLLNITTFWDPKNVVIVVDPFFPELRFTAGHQGDPLVLQLEELSITAYLEPTDMFPHSSFLAMVHSRVQQFKFVELKLPEERIPSLQMDAYKALWTTARVRVSVCCQE